MQNTPTLSSQKKLSRFNGLIILTLIGLAVGILLLVPRGDQIGVQIISVAPPDGARGVSANSDIRVVFNQPLDVPGDDSLLTFNPPVSGSSRWQGSTLVFTPDAPLAANTTYTAHLDDGLQGQQGQSVAAPVVWQFQTRTPALLFIAPDQAGIEQIFLINPDNGERAQLTGETIGVFDYSLSPDGATLVYAALREDGGSDLWAVSPTGGNPYLLLDCAGAACAGAVWDPGRARLVFEKRSMPAPGAAPGPPRLWWFDLATGEAAQMFDDNQILGYGARWSPDGVWLSYVSPNEQGVQLFSAGDGRAVLVPSRIGGLAVWSPQGDTFLMTDIQQQDEGFAVHLLKASPEDGGLVDISGENEPVEDSSPAWSPDGKQVAFTRKVAGAAMGKQVWLMNIDGSGSRYLTNQTGYHHGLPRWSPDGHLLAYQRFPLKEPGVLSGIWLLDVESGETREVVSPGNRPVWLP